MVKLYTGCMFAGKTTAMLVEANRLRNEGKRVGIFKPSFDTRYGKAIVKTHDNVFVEAYSVKNPKEIVKISDEFDVFCFDEVQFYDESIIEVLNTLKILNKIVVMSGLDRDYKRDLFPTTEKLFDIVDEVYFLSAKCHFCKDNARYSLRTTNSNNLFELGASDKYIPVCLECHKAHFNK